jgi:HK97 gp10 family phage protein
MISYRVEIPQLAKLQASFRAAPAATIDATMKAVNKSLVSLQGTAKQLAPVDTGRLRQGIQISRAQVKGNTISGAVYDKVKYAPYQEFGTGIHGPKRQKIRRRSRRTGRFFYQMGVKPKHFFGKSLIANEGTIQRYFSQALEEVARKLST